jgi:hypothetical protein
MERRKMRGKSVHHCRTERMRHVKHDVVGSPMFDKGAELILQIFGLLTGKAGYGEVAVVTLGGHAVAIFAVADFAL